MYIEDMGEEVKRALERYAVNDENNIIKPSFGRGSIADLPEVFGSTLGIIGKEKVPSLLRRELDAAEHVVFFFLDGFGHSTVRHAVEHYRMKVFKGFLSESEYTPITSVFPSTTSTATVTVQTQKQPLQHGIIGYTAYLSEIGTICNMMTLTPLGNSGKSILDNGWGDEKLLVGDTLYGRMRKSLLDSYLYIPSKSLNSGLTRITGKGAEVFGYHSIPQMFVSIRRNIEASRTGSFSFCYISSIDTLSHKIGPNSEEVSVEIENIFHLIEKELIEKLNITGSLSLMISADHGHTMVPSNSIKDAATDRRLLSYMRTPVVGDMRAPIIRIKPGRLHEAFDYIEDRYGKEFAVGYGADMMKQGYFGTYKGNQDSRDRFGDIILIPKGKAGLIDSRLTILDPTMNWASLVGVHGGLSKEEMIVPFISRAKIYHSS